MYILFNELWEKHNEPLGCVCTILIHSLNKKTFNKSYFLLDTLFQNHFEFEKDILKDTSCSITETERLLVVSYQTKRYHVNTLLDTILYTIQQKDKILLDVFNSNAVSIVISNYSEGDPTLQDIENIFKEYNITCYTINL